MDHGTLAILLIFGMPFVAIVGGLCIHAFMYGPQAAFIAEQFPTHVRYAGASLAYTLGGVFAGGIAPLAFQALYRAYGTTHVVAMYTTGALLITLLVLWASRKTDGRHASRQ